VATGRERFQGLRHDQEAGVGALVFTPDSKTLAASTGERGVGSILYLWDVTTGTSRRIVSRDSATAITVSPDGKTPAWGGFFNRAIVLWDVDRGQERLRIAVGTDGTDALAFSPDGKTLASVGFQDNTVCLRDAGTGKVRCSLREEQDGGASRVFLPDKTMVFLPDSKTLVSLGRDGGTVCFWDVTTGRRQVRLHAVPGPVTVAPEARTVSLAGEPPIPIDDLKAGPYQRTGR
jgi:WD40 repeat protein